MQMPDDRVGDHGIPADVAAAIREMGTAIEPERTRALYQPLQEAAGLTTAAARDVAYGPHPRHRLDLHVAPHGAGEPGPSAMRPVVMFVHGGAFVRGDKVLAGTPFYDNVMRWAVSQGWVGVNLTYRLAPEHPWPAGRDDVAAALAWTRAHIADHGGDPHRIVLTGHSAGATHVATMLAAGHVEGLAGAVLLSGVYDLRSFPGEPLAPYFGSDASQLAERSSLSVLAELALPLFVGCAELDAAPFRLQHERLVAAREAAGRPCSSIDLAGHGHLSELYALGTDDRQLQRALAAFVSRATSALPPAR